MPARRPGTPGTRWSCPARDRRRRRARNGGRAPTRSPRSADVAGGTVRRTSTRHGRSVSIQSVARSPVDVAQQRPEQQPRRAPGGAVARACVRAHAAGHYAARPSPRRPVRCRRCPTKRLRWARGGRSSRPEALRALQRLVGTPDAIVPGRPARGDPAPWSGTGAGCSSSSAPAGASRRSTSWPPRCCAPARAATAAGPTLIVSPLLALMRDQVAAATRAGIRAESINSANAQDWGEVRDRPGCRRGRRAAGQPGTAEQPALPRRAAARPGGSLRTPGRRRGTLHQRLGPRLPARLPADPRPARPPCPTDTPVLATTATANARVVADVAEQLSAGSASAPHEVTTLRGPLARDSLRLGVLPVTTPEQRIAWLLAHLGDAAGQRHRLHAHRRRGATMSPRRCARPATPSAPTPGAATPQSASSSRTRCGATSSRRWLRPAHWAWASTSRTWGSCCTWGRRPLRWPTTSRSVGPGGATERADVLLLPGSEDARHLVLLRLGRDAPRAPGDRRDRRALRSGAEAAVDGRAGDDRRRPADPAGAAAQGARRRRRGAPGQRRLDGDRSGLGLRRRALPTGGAGP